MDLMQSFVLFFFEKKRTGGIGYKVCFLVVRSHPSLFHQRDVYSLSHVGNFVVVLSCCSHYKNIRKKKMRKI